MAQNRKQEASPVQRYRKEELFQADQFLFSRDLLEALLEPDQEYTLDEAQEQIRNFLKGRVN